MDRNVFSYWVWVCWEKELGGGSWIEMREEQSLSFDANKDISSGLLTMREFCQQLFFLSSTLLFSLRSPPPPPLSLFIYLIW